MQKKSFFQVIRPGNTKVPKAETNTAVSADNHLKVRIQPKPTLKTIARNPIKTEAV